MKKKKDFWTELEDLLGIRISAAARDRLTKSYSKEALLSSLTGFRFHLASSTWAASIDTFEEYLSLREEPPEIIGPPPAPPLPKTEVIQPQPGIIPFGLAECSRCKRCPELIERLPPLMQALIENRLEGTEICCDFAVAGAISLVGACCGNRLRIRAWGDIMFPNTYIVLVGETGSSFKSAIPRWAKQMMSDVAPQFLAPDEGSVEALIKHLADQPSGLWIRDELAGLLASMKTADYMRPVREMLMTLYTHAGVYKRSLMRATYVATNPALSLLCTIQPQILGEELVSGRNVESGFLNRLLLVLGQGMEKRVRIPDAKLARHGLVDHLRVIAHAGVTEVDCAGVEDMANGWRGMEAEYFGEEYGEIVARRAGTHALKIAAILQAADGWPRGGILEKRWVEAAMMIIEHWFKRSAALLEEVHLKSDGERIRREMLKRISRNGGVDKPQLMRSMQLTKAIFEREVETLVEREQVVVSVSDNGNEHYQTV